MPAVVVVEGDRRLPFESEDAAKAYLEGLVENALRWGDRPEFYDDGRGGKGLRFQDGRTIEIEREGSG